MRGATAGATIGAWAAGLQSPRSTPGAHGVAPRTAPRPTAHVYLAVARAKAIGFVCQHPLGARLDIAIGRPERSTQPPLAGADGGGWRPPPRHLRSEHCRPRTFRNLLHRHACSCREVCVLGAAGVWARSLGTASSLSRPATIARAISSADAFGGGLRRRRGGVHAGGDCDAQPGRRAVQPGPPCRGLKKAAQGRCVLPHPGGLATPRHGSSG